MSSEIFQGVEDVWIIWALSLITFACFIYQAVKLCHWKTIRSFLGDERGASYALNYVMTFPIFLWVVCLIIQGTMILVVKIGVMHAAHMSARSAVVWRGAHPTDHAEGLEVAEDKAREAAVFNLVPYASGFSGHKQVYAYSPSARLRALRALASGNAYARWVRTAGRNTESPANLPENAFIVRKYQYAAAMTSVKLLQNDAQPTSSNNRFNVPMSVEVKFRMPIHVPWTGRIMGRMELFQRGYYRDVQAIATLPLETAETTDGHLGIAYDSARL